MNLYNKTKKRVYSIIGPTAKGDVISAIFDIALCLLIIASCAAVVLELVGVSEDLSRGLLTFEYVTVGIFIFEFLLRIWTAELSYPECKNKLEAIKEKKKTIVFSIIALLLLITICSLLMYAVEHETNGDVFKNGFSGILYGISSITNIGSFEGAPITQLGEVLSAIMILLGGCIFGVPVAIVADSFGKNAFSPIRRKWWKQKFIRYCKTNWSFRWWTKNRFKGNDWCRSCINRW